MLSVSGLNKAYHYAGVEQPVLRGLDLELAAASSMALLGESGSGKSTLLHLVAGLDRADGGEIRFDGRRIDDAGDAALAKLRRSRISLVFQQFHLISTLDVADNIRFQAMLARRFDAAYEAELVERLGLGAQLGKFPWQLSRGQQQRVAIARALAHRPALVLADEPTGNLDEATSLEVMRLFTELVEAAGSSLLMVTHSEAMAGFTARRVRLHDGVLAEIE